MAIPIEITHGHTPRHFTYKIIYWRLEKSISVAKENRNVIAHIVCHG